MPAIKCWHGSETTSPATGINAYIITEDSSLSLPLRFDAKGRYHALIQMTDCESTIRVKIKMNGGMWYKSQIIKMTIRGIHKIILPPTPQEEQMAN